MRPAVAADLFAGRGRFEDGSEGSPIIIARHAKRYREGFRLKNQVVLAEARADERQKLIENMKEYIDEGIAIVVPGEAANVGHFLLERIRPGVPLFVFLDPFGLKGLSMELLIDIFKRAKDDSTEVLINFNHRAMSRRLGLCGKANDANPSVRRQAETTTKLTNEILGGDWWIDVMRDESLEDDDKVEMIRLKYIDTYRQHFSYLGTLPVTKGLPGENVKYYLIFASQSQVAFELMNDVMKSAWFEYMLEVIREENEGTLFESVDPSQFASKDTCTDTQVLAGQVLEEARRYVQGRKVYYRTEYDVPLTRPEVRIGLVERMFARYEPSEYNDAIRTLLKQGVLVAQGSRTRISDQVVFRIAVTKEITT